MTRSTPGGNGAATAGRRPSRGAPKGPAPDHQPQPTSLQPTLDTPPVEAARPAEPGTDPVASLAGVARRFGDVQALGRLDMEINRARVTVLLGPNGAGKTTAIRLITGALEPDAGTVRVFGADPAGPDGEEIRRRCGVVSAKPSLYDRLSGWDNLRYAGELYGLGRGSALDGRIGEAADWFGIHPALDQMVGGYSTGMKTRLALARAVLHDPELLLLDEPTSGLDPESARSVLELVRQMPARGRSVLLCTHLLAEAQGLADEVVVVQDGTTLLRGDPADLANQYWPHPEVTFQCFGDRHWLDRLADHPAVVTAWADGDGVRAQLSDREAVSGIIRWLAELGAPLRAAVPWEPSLEDLYFAIRRDHRLATATADGPTDRTEEPT